MVRMPQHIWHYLGLFCFVFFCLITVKKESFTIKSHPFKVWQCAMLQWNHIHRLNLAVRNVSLRPIRWKLVPNTPILPCIRQSKSNKQATCWNWILRFVVASMALDQWQWWWIILWRRWMMKLKCGMLMAVDGEATAPTNRSYMMTTKVHNSGKMAAPRSIESIAKGQREPTSKTYQSIAKGQREPHSKRNQSIPLHLLINSMVIPHRHLGRR